MVALTLLSIIWAALTPLTLATKANITYPATIEIDLLSPQNTTYNRNLNYPPIVFGIQNAQAAYAYEWSIHYLIYGATDSSADAIPVIRGTAKSQLDENEFQYYVGDVAIAPMPVEGAVISLKSGAFRLEWDYATTPCIPEGKTSIYQQRTPFASGVSYFSIVEEGGLDFDEIPVGGACPSFGASWELETKKSCPGDKKAVDSGSGGKGDPCKSRLTSQKQVDCIWEFVSKGKNESETCLSAFERVDPDWPKYYTPGRGGFDNDNDDEGEDGGGSGSNGTDTSSGDSTGSDTDPKEDVGASLRPVISGIVLAVFGAVVMAL